MTPVRTAANSTVPVHRYDTHASSRWTIPRPGTDLASASSQKRFLIGGLFVALGLSPLTTLALSLIEVVPLYYGALFGVLPLLVCAGGLGVRVPSVGQCAVQGGLIGLLAVFLYDCTRIPFLLLGGWPDFISTIAMHLWPGAEPNWIVGYVWRYLGNGGGMGLAFTVPYRMTAPRMSVWPLAVGYGVAIWLCLIATLFLMPEATVLFELTPLTVSMSLLGHVVYGGVWRGPRARPPQCECPAMPCVSRSLGPPANEKDGGTPNAEATSRTPPRRHGGPSPAPRRPRASRRPRSAR